MNAAWAGVILAGVGVLFIPARWAVRLLLRTHDFLDDWAGQPARPGVSAHQGVMARLAAVEEDTQAIKAETKPDHGHSMRDIVHQTSRDLAEVKDDVAAMRSRVELFEHQREERAEDKPA